MAVQQLLTTNKLRIDFLSRHQLNWELSSFFDLDQTTDELFLLFTSSAEEHITHYIDDNVAILYKPKTFDIVGIQIDDFESEFSKIHISKAKEWRFSNKGETKESNWVLSLYVNEAKKGLCISLEKESLSSGLQTIINTCYPTKIPFRKNRTPIKPSGNFLIPSYKYSKIETAFSSKFLKIAIGLLFLFIFISLPMLFPNILTTTGEYLNGSAGGDSSGSVITRIPITIIIPVILFVLILFLFTNNKKK